VCCCALCCCCCLCVVVVDVLLCCCCCLFSLNWRLLLLLLLSFLMLGCLHVVSNVLVALTGLPPCLTGISCASYIAIRPTPPHFPRGTRAVLQLYPEDRHQMGLISDAALRAGQSASIREQLNKRHSGFCHLQYNKQSIHQQSLSWCLPLLVLTKGSRVHGRVGCGLPAFRQGQEVVPGAVLWTSGVRY